MKSVKEKIFDDFCNSFLLSVIEKTMAKSGCTVEDFFELTLEMANDGDRISQTITGLLLRQDGKPEKIWSQWITKAVDIYTPDESMLICGIYKYCTSNSGDKDNSCFLDMHFITASTQIYRCAVAGIEFAETIQSAMIEDFIKFYKNNKPGFNSFTFDLSESDEEIGRKIYFTHVENALHIEEKGCIKEDLFNINSESAPKQYTDSFQEVIKQFPTDIKIKFYSTPDIPLDKINNFKEKSKYQVDYNNILFYLDDTVFGKGDEGVIIDSNNITFKQAFLDTVTIPLEEIKNLEINGILNKKIHITTASNSKKTITIATSKKGASTLFKALSKIISRD